MRVPASIDGVTRWWHRPGRRWIVGVLVATSVVVFSVVLLTGGILTTKDRTWERIQAEGVIRVGMDPSFPPFEMLDEATGKPIGLDVDLAHALAEEMGLRAEVVNVGFDGLYDTLLSGRIDIVISALPVDYMWTKDIHYAGPYFEAGLTIVTRDELAVRIQGPEDLSGKRVAVEWGSGGDAYGRGLARRGQELDLLSYSGPGEALQAVADGGAEACLVDAVSALQFIRDHGGSEAGLTTVGAPLTEVSYAIAARQSSPLLAKALDKALQELEEDGTLRALKDKWL